MKQNKERYYWKKLLNGRGTVMVEFALIAPVLLMIGMFVIEMLQYHDANIMADHTAWRIARIASVHTDNKNKVTMPTWSEFKSEEFVAVMLMSTVTTGWRGNESSKTADAIVKAITDNKSVQFTGSSIISGLLDATGAVSYIKTFIDQTISGSSAGRKLSFMAKAYSRVVESDTIKISTTKIGKLDYPLITTNKNNKPATIDAYLVDVELNYPMRGGWLYKYFALSSNRSSSSSSEPKVYGRAMMVAETKISNYDVYISPTDYKPWGFTAIKDLITKAGDRSHVKKSSREKRREAKLKSLYKDKASLEKEISDLKSGKRSKWQKFKDIFKGDSTKEYLATAEKELAETEAEIYRLEYFYDTTEDLESELTAHQKKLAEYIASRREVTEAHKIMVLDQKITEEQDKIESIKSQIELIEQQREQKMQLKGLT